MTRRPFSVRSSSKKSSSKSILARAARHTPCVFEAVEARQLMSVALNNGVLTINGTAGNDKATIQDLGNGKYRVMDNGKASDFNKGSVQSVLANMGGGDDSFNAYGINRPMTILGGSGNDTLAGGRANDQIQGQDGNDVLNGYEGADVISGGNGIDEVQYFQHTGGVNVTLDGIANDGLYSSTNAFQSVEFDNILPDVENVSGSIYNDFLFGNDQNNTLNGYYGNDFIDGGKGNDVLKGGYGNDTLQGNEGNDSMWGGLGDDLLNGGAGIDDVRYDEIDHTSGVTAVLPNGGEYAISSGNGSYGENDRIRGNVENLVGSYYNDFLYGNSNANGISGMNGDDFISGGAGNDWINGNTGNDTLYGDGGDDVLWGEHGSDKMSGGAGWDTVRYDDSYHNSIGVGVNARLSMWYDTNKGGNGHYGENDYIYDDVEGLVGTKYGDILSGNFYNNYIAGLEGDDFIYGGAGNDTLDGGAGADWLYGEAGDDLLLGKDGSTSDHLDGGDGWDTIERDRSNILILIGGKFATDTYSNGEVIR